MKQIFYSLIIMSLCIMPHTWSKTQEELSNPTNEPIQNDYNDYYDYLSLSRMAMGKPFSQLDTERKKTILMAAVENYLVGFLNECGMMYWLGEEAINAYNRYQKLDNKNESIIDFPVETSLTLDTLYRESRILLDWLASKGIDVQQLEEARKALAEKYPDLKNA